MNRRHFIKTGLGVLILPFMGLSACAKQEPLRLGIHPWIGYETFWVAKENNRLPNNVQLIEGNSGSQSLARLAAGEVDAAALTMDEVLLGRSQGIPLTVAMVFDFSAGADQILAKKAYQNISDIRGARVAYEPTALGGLLLRMVLKKAKLRKKDVTLVVASPAEQEALWLNDDIDVAISYEPFASKMLKSEGSVLLSSKDFPEMIFDVLAVRQDRLDNVGDALTAGMKAHFLTLDASKHNMADYLYNIASRYEEPVSLVTQNLRGIISPNLTENYRLISGDMPLFEKVSALNLLMVSEGLIEKLDDLNDIFAPEYLPLLKDMD